MSIFEVKKLPKRSDKMFLSRGKNTRRTLERNTVVPILASKLFPVGVTPNDNSDPRVKNSLVVVDSGLSRT